ncbi:glycosyltransferase family 4 protein [Nonlabens marinus]|uniref:Glycosyl transferase, group 1 n=1 Tax=Nonlabens marinus S1-08 TaxID=1454201 RepID=W8W059_9FLAO|nr:glycosyltransferase family 4 protein [Nonlabens marinus]BAO55756.1 glycosyl transferase, group 1 [Nonlabens marinus S1-08]
MSAGRILYIGNQLSNAGKTSTTIDTLSVLLQKEGFKVNTASSVSNKLLRLLDMIRATLRYTNWSDYVLIDTYSTQNFWYAILIGKLCEKLQLKYIPILHGGALPNRLKTQPKLLLNFLEKAHQVVSPSDYLKHAFAKAGFHNIQIIPNSIELERYPYIKRKTFEPKLLWVRSFAEIYHPQMPLEVLKTLQTIFPNAQLTMVGPDKDGSLGLCQKIAEAENLNVTFTGLLTKEQWIELAATHDIFLNTSKFDNMPVSVLEAMALGLPIVSTDVGGIPFLLTNSLNALLVSNGDVQTMCASVTELVENNGLAQDISYNARKLVEHMDWQHIKSLWNNLLSD